MFLRLLLLIASLSAWPLTASAVSTSSFEIEPDADFFSTHHTVNTTTFEIEGSVDPIAGTVDTSSFTIESGSAFSFYCGDGFIDPGEDCEGSDLGGATCVSEGFTGGSLSCNASCVFVTSSCTSGSGGSGGGGGGRRAVSTKTPSGLEAPSLDPQFQGSGLFTYSSLTTAFGTRTSDTEEILINGKTDGVTYPSTTTWFASFALSLGVNVFDLEGSADGDTSDDSTTFIIYRRLLGDAVNDNRVDDFDLSRVSRSWGSSDPESDFTENGLVDDFDFSILVSMWAASF